MRKKKTKSSVKVPFYLKPFQKVLEQSTNLTLSYLYDYSVEFYGETETYETWLTKVRDFMSKSKLGEKENEIN